MRLLYRLVVVCLCVVCSFLEPVHAGTLPPEISAGANWLGGQITANGTLQDEATSVAAGPQVRAEVHQTLVQLGLNVPAALRSAVSTPSEPLTEYQARAALQLALISQVDPNLLSQLAGRQNTDGGFGGDVSAASHPLDTALALLAFGKSYGSVNGLSDTQFQAAINYLAQSQSSGGGWGPQGQPRIYDTTMVLQALAGLSQRFPSVMSR